ncbi:DUF3052 domain-containing protein [Paucibacter sp. DJ1R-11]|uniref:DUF3052 domain-containing protein n=1 Tax=Paucibacter sp. DJ1R-11 TaxID=2893556 RepID=UPI0021E4558C|nr:DUF3052 domain-containing protein [Paucibacter sp. DJ1R-11]MCV2365189.1 DUF3052 domain-containing protein [Paucibacter sp. DJ1R-11]
MASAHPAGYSGTPLFKKLGIHEACRVLLLNAPEAYEGLLAPLPPAVQFVSRPDSEVDVAQVFVTQRDVLEKTLSVMRKSLKPSAALWVSWPKKSSKLASTVTEDTIRELALPLGYVDVKVCAVTEVWSGLKLVLRKELR